MPRVEPTRAVIPPIPYGEVMLELNAPNVDAYDHVVLAGWILPYIAAGREIFPRVIKCECGAKWDGHMLAARWGPRVFFDWPEVFIDYVIFHSSRIYACWWCDSYYRTATNWEGAMIGEPPPKQCECEGCLEGDEGDDEDEDEVPF